MKNILWLPSILILSLLLVGCGKGIKNPLNWEITDFNYINQENEEFGLKDLKGKVWVADFIFTNCETVCSPMTANMVDLQEKLKEEGLDVEIISFSVDPEMDTPEMLKEYAIKFDADLSSWNLLTGYSQKSIEEFATKSFKTLVKKPNSNNQVIHGTSFYLVNQEGKVVKDYNGLSDVPYDLIVNDAKILLSMN
ncbi:SCO family protein [Bacillus sp. 31A1R]|uniref:SCO family protein n=1 Tax=Robertmurraya mangrovi TaxID=3098077 RepID=A0ABU5J457_9BACI|nr:SCO family protein [Bacillus sp. 31A1R]MDZ5474173.1 SCO family protein [Bacillus sp. 31A1R]